MQRNSWAQCSRQLQVYIRLLTQRGGEAHLQAVVSLSSTQVCIPARSELCCSGLGQPVEGHPHLGPGAGPGLKLPVPHLRLLKDLISCEPIQSQGAEVLRSNSQYRIRTSENLPQAPANGR
jgi:hypothetical protein